LQGIKTVERLGPTWRGGRKARSSLVQGAADQGESPAILARRGNTKGPVLKEGEHRSPPARGAGQIGQKIQKSRERIGRAHVARKRRRKNLSKHVDPRPPPPPYANIHIVVGHQGQKEPSKRRRLNRQVQIHLHSGGLHQEKEWGKREARRYLNVNGGLVWGTFARRDRIGLGVKKKGIRESAEIHPSATMGLYRKKGGETGPRDQGLHPQLKIRKDPEKGTQRSRHPLTYNS